MSDTSDRHNRFLAAVRRAVADYMSSEGCTCCQDIPAHEKARLARLLSVPKYDDGSGYNFTPFRSPERKVKP